MTKEEALSKGLPTFNEVPHKLIEIDEPQTLILKLPNGVYVTVNLAGNRGNWACLDIEVHGSSNQRMIGFANGTSQDMEAGLYSLDVTKEVR